MIRGESVVSDTKVTSNVNPLLTVIKQKLIDFKQFNVEATGLFNRGDIKTPLVKGAFVLRVCVKIINR